MERRRRTGTKRTQFQVPKKMPLAVRELWRSATEEEQQRAHRQATVILAHWLGRKSKQEAAEELEVKPLRIWQLSQMAVSGMVAGLLKQPRSSRGRMVTSPEDDPKVLQKRILKLEEEVKSMERLLQLIRDLPLSQAEVSGGKKVAIRNPKKSRTKAGGDGKTSSGRGRSDGENARGVAADGVVVEACGGDAAAAGGPTET